MKKLLTGLLCGIVLMVATAAVSSDTIQATLFPSKVTIHNGDQEISVDGNEMINYNNKAYIPLRTFSEAMGATVNYQYPSESTDGLHKIGIYQEPSLQWKLERREFQRCEGYPFYIVPGSFTPTNPYKFSFYLYNFMDEDILMSPVDLVFEVYSTKADTGEMDTLVYSQPLSTFEGLVPSQYGYRFEIPWDRKGMDGEVLPTGDYFIKLKRPFEVTYSVVGSDELKTQGIYRGMGCNLEYYRTSLE
ncbi:stalk domain-containing protein [Paenibacillus sp. J2TS4]|uniref:stalk domain-containing protein n=1 Tax=Paenibacillus sp. J2TS4 TaxID=2807194 RepID=UPI001BD0B53A|nr:stalk domain-containing protein [Paenibacillus sp. J2TS4]